MKCPGAGPDRKAGVEAHAEYGDPVQQLGRFGRSWTCWFSARAAGAIGLLGTGIAQRLADAPPCPLLVVQQLGRIDRPG